MRHLCREADLEEAFIDSTAIRAHQHAAGALKKKAPQALGRSRGGWGSKIHRIVDALSNSLTFTLTAAHIADSSAAQLVSLNKHKYMCAHG